AWKKLSKSVRDGYEGCGICGTPRAQLKRLACHEIWDEDEDHHIRHLRGFIALCDLCHHVKHIGLAGNLAGRGQLDFEAIVEHFLAVNQCTREQYEQHSKLSWERWERLSHYQDWLIDLGDYAYLVPKDYTIDVGITGNIDGVACGLAYEKKPFV